MFTAPPHTRLSQNVLLALTCLFTTFPTLALDFPSINVTIPETPDFSNDSGFSNHQQPTAGFGDSSPWTEKDFLEEIQKDYTKSLNSLFSYTQTSGSRSKGPILEVTSNDFSLDLKHNSLRFVHTAHVNRAVAITLSKNAGLTLDNLDYLQIYGSGNYALLNQGKNSSLEISSKNIWLQNDTLAHTNYYIMDTVPTAQTVISATDNFVAWLDMSVDSEFDLDSMALFGNGKIELSAKNVYIHFENQTEHKTNAVAFSLDGGERLSTFGSEDAFIEMFYIDGVQTGFYSDSKLDIHAKKIIFELDSEHSANGLKAGYGFLLQRNSTINAEQLVVTGAHTAISSSNSHTNISALNDGIYLDTKGHTDGSGNSYGLSANDALIDVKTNNFLSLNSTVGLMAESSSNIQLEASNLIIQNNNNSGDIAVSIAESDGKITANSILLENYETGISANRTDPTRHRPVVEISATENLVLSNVSYGLNTTDSSLSVTSGNLSILGLKTNSNNTAGILADKGSTVNITNSGGQLNIERFKDAIVLDGSDLTIKSSSLHIQTENGYVLQGTNDASATIVSTEKSQVIGDIESSNSELSISLGNQSFFKGAAKQVEKGTIDLSLGNESNWNITDYSSVNNLNLNNSNILITTVGSLTNPSLSVSALSGESNTFILNNDATLNSVSFIELGKDSQGGTHKIQLSQSIDKAELGSVKIQFATDKSKEILFEASQSITDAGLFVITPEITSSQSVNGNDWFITNIKEDPAPTPTAMLDGFQNNYLFWRTLTDSTKERFGQLRHGQSAGVWGRVTAGSLSQGDLTNDYQTYRLGADTSIQPGLSLGAMFEIHEGDLDTSNGKGDMQAITAAIYGLYVSPSGYYADAGFRFGVMDYEYKNTALLYDEYDYNSSAVGAWLEVGKEWAFANNYTLTPHLAVNFGRFGTEHFTSDNGLKAKVDSVNSVIFTVGTDVGYKTETFEVSAVADLMTEVAGSQDIRISHNAASLTRSADYSDTWMEFGLSASYRPTDETLLWVNGRRSAFADLDNDWRINAGVRWSFY